MILIVLFVRSVGLWCGVYGAENCCRALHCSMAVFVFFPVNCTPLSNISVFGAPTLAIIRFRNTFKNASAASDVLGL